MTLCDVGCAGGVGDGVGVCCVCCIGCVVGVGWGCDVGCVGCAYNGIDVVVLVGVVVLLVLMLCMLFGNGVGVHVAGWVCCAMYCVFVLWL